MPTRVTDIEVRLRTKPGEQQIDSAAISRIKHGPGVRRDLRRRARNVQALAKTLVGVRTGRLRGTIRVSEGGHGRGDAASVAVIAGRPGLRYTGWHHDGTRSHEIRPNSAKALRFTSGGKVVFAKRVRHPGTTGSKFLLRATRAWRP